MEGNKNVVLCARILGTDLHHDRGHNRHMVADTTVAALHDTIFTRARRRDYSNRSLGYRCDHSD